MADKPEYREGSLPQWAQSKLRALRQEIVALRQEFAEQTVSTLYVQSYYLGTKRYLGARDEVTFELDDRRQTRVCIRHDRIGPIRSLHVTTPDARRLVVTPDVSNVLHLGVTDL